MPYGLACAPSVFQDVLRDFFFGRFVIAYIDDILIYSPYVKSEFHVSTITFLGYIISDKGVATDEGQLKAVRE